MISEVGEKVKNWFQRKADQASGSVRWIGTVGLGRFGVGSAPECLLNSFVRVFKEPKPTND